MPPDENVQLNEIHNYNVNIKTGEIYLHGYHTDSPEEPGVEFRMATQFIKNLHILSNQKHILIHLHTIGGNWHDGIAIYDAVILAKTKTTMLGYGSVSSMSSVILQSAQTRVLMPNTEFMVHWGGMSVEGNSLAVESSAKQNKKSNETMLDIYAERCAEGNFFKNNNRYKTVSSVRNFIRKTINQNGDWYLTAEEAVDYGFADAVLGQKGYKDIGCLISKK